MLKKWIMIAFCGLLFLGLIAACAQSGTSPVPEAVEVNGQVEALIIERCGTCHTADRVFRADYTRQGWSDVLDNMIAKGANVSAEEKETMIDWLLAQ